MKRHETDGFRKFFRISKLVIKILLLSVMLALFGFVLNGGADVMHNFYLFLALGLLGLLMLAAIFISYFKSDDD